MDGMSLERPFREHIYVGKIAISTRGRLRIRRLSC